MPPLISYNEAMKILIVEDDQKIGAFISNGLKESGYTVDHVLDGESAEHVLLTDSSIDLVILDLMLPKKNGVDVLKEIRSQNFDRPILILSAKRSVDDKIAGLQLGADDYLEKPFSFSELLARVQALLRRSLPKAETMTKLSRFGIEMNLVTREVSRDKTVIDLQAKEFSLLEYFLRNPERPLSKAMILDKVYGYNFDTQTNVVDVLVFRLRNKIDKDFETKTIHTMRGLGYVFKKDS
jgi:two-component system OmpR family response regulator